MQAKRVKKDPGLECNETCQADYQCDLVSDGFVFPRSSIREGSHNQDIVDGSKMEPGEIYDYLKVDTRKNGGTDTILQEIEKIGKKRAADV